MPAQPTPQANTSRPCRRRGVARWWLAGLLVSCLLPVGLSACQAARLPAGQVYALALAPAIRRVRRRSGRRRRAIMRRRRPGRCCSRLPGSPARVPGLVAALDAVSRRGPPASLLKTPCFFAANPVAPLSAGRRAFSCFYRGRMTAFPAAIVEKS
ncbi:hypothetical protein P1P91_07135 [Halomonas piscis]|uniref:Uncharacterized protein n=1 Tax=Halomonas piscis TaxID=3031727 RepID=A0ABY9Z2S1_9GAMM|nr:hypothetical protein [Halomonas piscis]WNK21437.1 hypothetical protein P1P91_07135 [Halomonas piscis]